jgi:hypothetical protein
MRDQFNNLQPLQAGVAAPTDDTAVTSGIVDLQGYKSLTFMIAAGTLADADATFTVSVAEGDESDLSDAAAVADADLLGTEVLASFQFDDDGETRKIGYIGTKRYVQLTITPANNGGAAPIAVIPVLGSPAVAPVANPPA